MKTLEESELDHVGGGNAAMNDIGINGNIIIDDGDPPSDPSSNNEHNLKR